MISLMVAPRPEIEAAISAALQKLLITSDHPFSAQYGLWGGAAGEVEISRTYAGVSEICRKCVHPSI